MNKKILHKQLLQKDCKGNRVNFHEKNNKENKYRGYCIDEVVEIPRETEYAHRLQKIIWCEKRINKKWVRSNKKDFRVTIRACYYTIKANRKGLVFGQYCMNSEPEVVGALFSKAQKRGFFKEMTPDEMQKEIKGLQFLRIN